MRLLAAVSSLLGFLDFLHVLDFGSTNFDLPAGFLLLGARLVVAIAGSSCLSGLFLLIGLLFLFFSLSLLLALLLVKLLLLFLLLFEERGYTPLVFSGLITHCYCVWYFVRELRFS